MGTRTRLQFTGMTVILLIITSPLSAQTVIIDSLIWTDKVVEKKYNTTYDTRANVQSIVVWLKVRCDATAFSKLRTTGKLPLIYKWFHKQGIGWSPQNPKQPDDLFDLTIDQLDSVNNELDRGNYAEWVSWSNSTNLTPGLWRVVVVLAHNNVELIQGKIRIRSN